MRGDRRGVSGGRGSTHGGGRTIAARRVGAGVVIVDALRVSRSHAEGVVVVGGEREPIAAVKRWNEGSGSGAIRVGG